MIETNDNEHIIEVVWDHWFVLIGKLLTLIMALLVPVLALFLFNIIPIEKVFTVEGSTFALKSYFICLWLIIVWMIGWNLWTNYFLNVLVITDIRIFDITQLGFFRRQSSSFRIDHIQNVTVEQVGVLATLLDFGTIRFETAGENINFVAKYIPTPYEVKKLIDGMQDGELDKSQEVHLHPDTLDRIVPAAPPSEIVRNDTKNIGTFVNDGL